jgi:hypothetical protein
MAPLMTSTLLYIAAITPEPREGKGEEGGGCPPLNPPSSPLYDGVGMKQDMMVVVVGGGVGGVSDSFVSYL